MSLFEEKTRRKKKGVKRLTPSENDMINPFNLTPAERNNKQTHELLMECPSVIYYFPTILATNQSDNNDSVFAKSLSRKKVSYLDVTDKEQM